MRHLCHREMDAWRMGQKSEAMGFLEKERGFLFEHPARWVPTFCDEVVRWSKLGFYGWVVRMTKVSRFGTETR